MNDCDASGCDDLGDARGLYYEPIKNNNHNNSGVYRKNIPIQTNFLPYRNSVLG